MVPPFDRKPIDELPCPITYVFYDEATREIRIKTHSLTTHALIEKEPLELGKKPSEITLMVIAGWPCIRMFRTKIPF